MGNLKAPVANKVTSLLSVELRVLLRTRTNTLPWHSLVIGSFKPPLSLHGHSKEQTGHGQDTRTRG